MKVPLLATLLLVASAPLTLLAAENTYDFVIYGPTSAGVAAAVQAKRMDKSVIIVGPDKHLGGLSAGGLGWTDSGNKAVIGGVSREFYQRLRKYYDDPKTWRWQNSEDYKRYRAGDDAQWTFEPHLAERVFEDLIREYKIPVVRDEWLNRKPGRGVTKKDGRITSITMLSGNTYHGKMFMDATYEGDLMAAAGTSYTTGREPNSKYDEKLNGVQTANARSHQFRYKISPYKVPGDPKSGLLPRVHDGEPGKQGEGDHRLQAYNYRMCLTREPENRVPFPKPDGYDASQYELLLRSLKAGSRHIRGKFDMLPNLKTDTNNHGSFSTDNIGMNYDYPDATYERRAEILVEHRTYQQGYCWFLANDPRVPADVRSWYGAWGLAKDEFQDNGHWPHQIYVREARRMVSDFVVNENHLKGGLATPKSVGMGSYNMDSHNTQRYVDAEGHVRNEGDVQVSPGGPYPIDYDAIVPKKSECENLLVPVCVSSSHIAFGSIRMEPVFMILGQSAATAASIAIDKGQAVQDVDYEELSERLLADKQVLRHAGGKAEVLPASSLKGVVVDDSKIPMKNQWVSSRSLGPFVEYGYRHDDNANKGKLIARFEPKELPTGKYDVRLSYSTQQNRATNVPVTIIHADGEKTVAVNQQKKPAVGGLFHSLGTYRFEAGKPAAVVVSNKDTNGYVILDAVQWVKSDK